MNNTRQDNVTFKIAAFCVMLLIGGVMGYLVHQWRAQQGNGQAKQAPGELLEEATQELTEKEALAAIEQKDSSLAYLENGANEVEWEGRRVPSMAVGVAGFEQLAEMVPTEILPLRNLTIGRLLLLQNAQGDIEAARETAFAAAQRLLDRDPESAVAQWLAAKILLQVDPANPLALSDEMRERAVALLQKATQLEPDNAIYWFTLREAATAARDRTPSPLAKQALEKAFAVNPRNIFLLTEVLLMQVATQDTAIQATLDAAQDVFSPLSAAVKRRARLDLMQQIEAARQAVQEGQWIRANAAVRILQNVVRPEEVAKLDIVRVDVHPTEFVLYDFSPEFYARYGRPEPVWRDTAPVELQVVQDPLLAGVDGVLDMRLMDFTLSGFPDLLVLQPGKLSVFSRPAIDQPWFLAASMEVPTGMTGILAADLDRDRRKAVSAPQAGSAASDTGIRFDNVISATDVCHDADPDVVVYGAEGVRVYRNELEEAAGVPNLVLVENEGLQALSEVTAGVLIDLDHDGELDLAFSSAEGVTLWQCGAAMAFTETTEFSQMPPAGLTVTRMIAVDWDRDADIDIVLGGPTGHAAGWLEGLRHGEFRWQAFGDEYEQLGEPSGMALLEADGNVSWDLLTTGAHGTHLYRTVTPRSSMVQFLSAASLNDQPARDLLVWDFDNDGFRDAAVWGSGGLQVLRGGTEGAFAPTAIVPEGFGGEVTVAVGADLDRDGDQDLVAATPQGITLLRNEGGNGQGWLTLYPLGQSDNKGRCNHHAIGSLVELRSGGWYQAQVADSFAVHFGLGDQKTAQQIRVVWTNGVPQNIADQAGNVAICEPMALKGSCPYVYTWHDGEFSFLTDCLWAAPLGMQMSDGTVAPSRSWEYLLIPGQRLTPYEGSYWIKLTEELWEAGYFDHVQLIAVDHPADVEIYSNEKVGPPDIAEFKIHTVRQRRFPLSAMDQRGRDWSDALRHRDGEFVKAFEQRLRQGLTPEHYLELDLGQLHNPQQITLFLTGWIFPTDTSLNVAFFQDPETDGPRMPSVWVPDAEGVWQEAIAYMGFPGGKTKTIAVDLSQAFLTDDYRVRIATTAEIYWDEVFFTVDDEPVEIRQIPLALQDAQLGYQGFSREIPRPDDAPQMYDHRQISRDPAWPPMRGRFTRYGSVTELIATADDLLAVLGAGDAMTVRFAVPDEEPPAGWKRDFFLHSVGWDKDADLNTIYGQSVEPLPFRAMTSYPWHPNDPIPHGDVYEQYLRRYQTREQDPAGFWRFLMP